MGDTGEDVGAAADVVTNPQNPKHAALGFSEIADLGVHVVVPEPV
jgi:hypothetical protein